MMIAFAFILTRLVDCGRIIPEEDEAQIIF